MIFRKKALCAILLVAVTVSFFSACARYPKALEDYLVHYSADDWKSSNGVLEPYFSETVPKLEGTQYLQDYIQSGAASEDFKALHAQAEQVEPIPVYGAYLESTSVQALLFWKDSTLLGVKCVIVPEDSNAHITEFSTYLSTTNYEYALNDERFCGAIKLCFQADPGFCLVGIMMAYQSVRPIGIPAGSNHIEINIMERISPFDYVEPFSVIADGAKAYEAYWAKHAEIRSSIPIWPWDRIVPDYGYITQYYHQGAGHQYLKDYDTSVAVPLLDYNGAQKVYILHLLYLKNELIAEVILEKKQDENDSYVVAVMERVAEKDSATGEYTPLTSITYVETVEKLLAKSNRNAEVKGIGYNGKDFRLIYEE